MSTLAFGMLWIVCTLLTGVLGLGHWQDLSDSELFSDPYSNYYQWRGFSAGDLQDSKNLTISFSAQSPCRALTIRDNCFSHNPKRADALLRRTRTARFKPASLNLPASLYDLKDQAILFIGDSTVVSVYASLVCHFSQAANVSYKLVWQYESDTILTDERKQDKCPGHLSCHLIGGQVHLASHNITLAYQQLNQYRGNQRETFKQILERSADLHTIVIVNFGVHYNHDSPFMHDMMKFTEDMVSYFQRQRQAKGRVAQWLWLESFPQHFPGNGYFPTDPAVQLPAVQNGTLHCQAVQNETLYYEEDWRNRLAEIFLPDFKRSSRLIPIAAALYDQWDAHVDYGDSLRVSDAPPDCTHYCLGSGVFRFVLNQVLTSVGACLQGKCKENHFFDGYVEPKAKPKVKRASPPVRCSRIPGAAPNKPAIGIGARQQLVPRGKRDPNCA